MPRPTPERVREFFDYDPETGLLTHRLGFRAGRVAREIKQNGYVYASIDGSRLLGHMIAWAHVYGKWPDGRINIVNGDRSDNRISSLVEVFKSDPAKELTHERLLSLVHYDPETGVFTWKRWKGSPTEVGAEAGCAFLAGRYRTLTIDQRPYMCHRLAWFYVHGKWPQHEIDHIDGNGRNNAISNLRDVTHAVNMQNIRSKTARNKRGSLMGVSVGPVGGITSSLTVRGKSCYLGSFDSEEDAHAAYIAAKRQMHEGCTI